MGQVANINLDLSIPFLLVELSVLGEWAQVK